MESQLTWLNVKELAAYLKCSESTIYHKVSAGEIPFSKKSGLRFYRPAIDKWMMEEQDYYDPKSVEQWQEKKGAVVPLS